MHTSIVRLSGKLALKKKSVYASRLTVWGSRSWHCSIVNIFFPLHSLLFESSHIIVFLPKAHRDELLIFWKLPIFPHAFPSVYPRFPFVLLYLLWCHQVNSEHFIFDIRVPVDPSLRLGRRVVDVVGQLLQEITSKYDSVNIVQGSSIILKY